MVSGGRVMMVGGWEGFGTEGRDELELVGLVVGGWVR